MSPGITERALDRRFESEVEDRLRGLDSTGASDQWLSEFFQSPVTHEISPWQVGEAIAETVLANSDGVRLPWNSRRDARNPRASLPGPDLVGISDESDGHRLVFGEFKSSSDTNSPPGVVHGKDGLDQQLERLIEDKSLQRSLIKWLSARSHGGEARADFDEAFRSFVQSWGTAVRFIGVLVRDTTPNENDISRRGRALGERVAAPGSVELQALYMPSPMAEWAEWVAA